MLQNASDIIIEPSTSAFTTVSALFYLFRVLEQKFPLKVFFLRHCNFSALSLLVLYITQACVARVAPQRNSSRLCSLPPPPSLHVVPTESEPTPATHRKPNRQIFKNNQRQKYEIHVRIWKWIKDCRKRGGIRGGVWRQGVHKQKCPQ